MARFGMVIDTARCVGCMDCVTACKTENGVPQGFNRDWIVYDTVGTLPGLHMEIRSERCNHCDNPPCVYASARDARDSHSPWMLVPRSIPFMEEKLERFSSVRQSRGATVPDQFPAAPGVFQIPARATARLLLDQAYLTTAYPEVVVSGGRGATITLRYAESLYQTGPRGATKDNRNEVDGKELVGYRDVFVADGGRQRMFRPLWWRTYRYVELAIETLDAPLSVEDLRGAYTGYPFVRKARLEIGDALQSQRLGRILDTGWRTARLCAHETYMDCPYYEQLQYVGDTRIQGLVSLYTSGDARLLRNAIDQLNDSRVPEGATMSRAPTRTSNCSAPFSESTQRLPVFLKS